MVPPTGATLRLVSTRGGGGGPIGPDRSWRGVQVPWAACTPEATPLACQSTGFPTCRRSPTP